MATKNPVPPLPANRVAGWLTPKHEQEVPAADPESPCEPASADEWRALIDLCRARDTNLHGQMVPLLHRTAVALGTTFIEFFEHGVSGEWEQHAANLMLRVQFGRRVEGFERRIKNLEQRIDRLNECSEGLPSKTIEVPISTFAPEPFEAIGDLRVVVRPDEDCFVATLFDVNLSAAGDTPEEAVTNLKDIIVMVIKEFEREKDERLGPAMRRQKQALGALIRRR